MPMVAGILKKVRQSGELATIHADVVYKNDKFRYWVDTEGQHIEHEPELFGDRGAAIGVYAIAKTKDGSVFVQPLSLADVEKIRASSRSKDGGPWVSWWSEMAKKSAIRRLAKYLPQSTDVEQALKADEDLFMPDLPAKDHAENQELLANAQIEPPKQRKTRLDKVKESAAITTSAQTAEPSTDAMPPIPDNMRRGRDEQPPMPEPGSFEPEDVI